jgi:hypothetical protein
MVITAAIRRIREPSGLSLDRPPLRCGVLLERLLIR